jgi:hypothetical protein
LDSAIHICDYRTPDFHLPSVKFSLADYAKTLVIERSAVSKSIFSTQHREPIVEFEMGNHNAKGSLLSASRSTIGPLDDCVIGQNPRRHLITW